MYHELKKEAGFYGRNAMEEEAIQKNGVYQSIQTSRIDLFVKGG